MTLAPARPDVPIVAQAGMQRGLQPNRAGVARASDKAEFNSEDEYRHSATA